MATLIIKNLKTAPAEKSANLWNTGLAALATGEAKQEVAFDELIPACNTKQFAGTIEVPIYGNNNQYYLIPAGGELEVNCTTDAEVLFYMAMVSETLTVVEKGDEAPATTPEEEVPETPVEDDTEE